MDLLGSVDADSDKKVVLFQELPPFIIQKDAIGLQRICDLDAFGRIFLLKRKNPAKVIDTQNRRFAALPGKRHLGHACLATGLYQLADIALQYVWCHTEFFFRRIELFLFEVVAIFTGDVAPGTDRLGHYVKWRGRSHGSLLTGGHRVVTLRCTSSRVRSSNVGYSCCVGITVINVKVRLP